MRKFLFLVLIVALAVIFSPWLHAKESAALNQQAAFFVNNHEYSANGRSVSMDAAPFIENSRVFVPVRFLGHALGIGDDGIVWNDADKSVIMIGNGITVKLTLGSNKLIVNQQERAMDVVPVLREGRVFLPARWVAESLGYEVKWVEGSQAVLAGPPGKLPALPPARPASLPSVGSLDNLRKLLSEAQSFDRVYPEAMKSDQRLTAAPEMAKNMAANDSTSGAGLGDYSKTNVQVEGVDEADIVKTDGSYIYFVSGERVVIAKAYPVEDMKVANVLEFSSKLLSPQEVYVDHKHLVVIGQNHWYRDMPLHPMGGVLEKAKPSIMPYPHYPRDMARAAVYDISNKADIKLVRELEVEGNYVSSRKIGSALYLITNKYIYGYNSGAAVDLRPSYRDSAASDGYNFINYPDIKYFPGFRQANYLMVAGLNLDRSGDKANVSAYLGSGENIYASAKNLYVAVTEHRFGIMEDMPGLLPQTRRLPQPAPVNQNKTKIYKFSLNKGQVIYQAGGEAPGNILNQFSMDEHGDFFRIATTTGDMWREDEHTSKNNVYILDKGLKQIGKIEGIAPGEKIYSTRFMGDRVYMVTFRTVDPFFVIDLKDPYQPRILGALKIPGYSDYLHPYDDNHVIGFGKDTVEVSQKDWSGRNIGTTAFYTGMKMAIFDVSDVSNPVEKFKENIGGRGTHSELLNNHRALLFSRERNLLAFPITVMEVDGSSQRPGDNFPQHGQFKFQGAYVYNFDLNSGIQLKGKITHLSGEDYLKMGYYYGHTGDKHVQRVIYIKDRIYTLSGKYIKANSLPGLEPAGSLELK